MDLPCFPGVREMEEMDMFRITEDRIKSKVHT